MNQEPPASRPELIRAESDATADRVTVIAGRTLLLREVPVQSPFSVNLMFDRFQALAHDWDRFAYVVDLTEAKRPIRKRARRSRPRFCASARASHISRSRSGTIC